MIQFDSTDGRRAMRSHSRRARAVLFGVCGVCGYINKVSSAVDVLVSAHATPGPTFAV